MEDHTYTAKKRKVDVTRAEADSTTDDMEVEHYSNSTKMKNNNNNNNKKNNTLWQRSQGPGIRSFIGWKPPPIQTFKTSKTFYFEIDNTNWTMINKSFNADAEHDTESSEWNILCPPYYYWNWWQVYYYLAQGEYLWFKNNTNYSRIKNTKFQVNVVGHRLPFTTNSETVSMANSEVDQTLDVFRGINKLYPHIGSISNAAGTDLSSMSFIDMEKYRQKLLYGNTLSNSSDDPAMFPATCHYNTWNTRPYIHKLRDRQDNADALIQYHRFINMPDLANKKWLEVDLRKYRGPIVQIDHECKNGVIFKQPSLMEEFPYSANRRGIITQDQGILVKNNEYNDKNVAENLTITTAGKYEMDKEIYYKTDIENRFHYTNNLEEINYDSLWFGVRPTMNGSEIQVGKTQIEIKTECEIEYMVYWSAPSGDKWTKNSISDLSTNTKMWDAVHNPSQGLTNDLQLLKTTGRFILPAHMQGNKLMTSSDVYRDS